MDMNLSKLTHVSEAYLKWMNDAEVMKYTQARYTTWTHDKLYKYIENPNLFGIMVDRLHVGNIKIDISRHGIGEVGIIIGKDHWGKGYATEAVIRMNGYAKFKGVRKLIACIYSENKSSIRVFKKAGYRCWAVLKKYYGESDNVIMGKDL